MSTTKTLIRNCRMLLGQDGGGGVDVELTDAQFTLALRLALSAYNYYFPIRSVQSYKVGAGATPITPDPPIRGILDISIIPERSLDGATLLPGLFSPFAGLDHRSGPVMLGYGSGVDPSAPIKYANYREWAKGTEQTFSSTPGYFFEEDKNLLHVYSPSYSVLVTVTGALDHDFAFDEEEPWETDPEKFEELDPEEVARVSQARYERLDQALRAVKRDHISYLRSGMLAQCKKMLGMVRRKFSSIPTTDGESVQFDGSELVQEGNEEWTSFKDELKMIQGEPAPLLF